MSRLNKVNKDHYTAAGRLAPDEIARERMQHIRQTARPAGRPKLSAPAKKSRRVRQR